MTAAAADYFFDKRWKATLAALALNAIPVDREVTNRRSADLMAGLIEDGWSLVIYPEGGRSPDGWGQTFKGGAAYLAGRTGAPVVPVYIDGTDSIMGKGTSVPKPGRTRVTFGSPLRRRPEESTRRFNDRIERAVATLADESTTDFWSARRRAAAGATPTLTGPAYTGWRRRWDARRSSPAGHRRLAHAGPATLARPRLIAQPGIVLVGAGTDGVGSELGTRCTRVHRGLEVGDDVRDHRRQHRLRLLPGDVTGTTGDEQADNQRAAVPVEVTEAPDAHAADLASDCPGRSA